MLLIDSTEIVPRTQKVITKIANPIADSTTATVGTNEENNWPIISSEETENTKKFEFTPKYYHDLQYIIYVSIFWFFFPSKIVSAYLCFICLRRFTQKLLLNL